MHNNQASSISFDLCGVKICVSARAPQLITVFADYFRHYQPRIISPRAGDTDPCRYSPDSLTLHLRMRRALPASQQLLPDNAQLLTQSGPMELWRAATHPESFYFINPVTVFRVIPQLQRMTGLITPQALHATHILTNTWALFGLLLLLRSQGIYHLHSAAVRSPDDKLFLFCGGQRSGKTTLTTALGIAGWKPLADDSLLLQQSIRQAPATENASVQITPLKKNFHLSRELLNRWTELQGLVWKERDEDRVSAAGLEFFDTLRMADSSSGKADHIILPQITEAHDSRLIRVSASETLLALAEQSAFLQIWSAQTQQQMQLLAELVRHASCWRLQAGTDILSSPRSAAQLLESTG